MSDAAERPDAIVVKNLSKYFLDFRALEDVSFSVPKGGVAGFIGANGAGKTTTMRLMAALDAPDTGFIEIAGNNVTDDPRCVRTVLGWMPDSYLFYRQMTVIEYLELFCRAYGYRGKEVSSRVDTVMQFTGLTTLSTKFVESLSKGMSQRLCLGRTLLHDPEVLILDEPAAGLDPQARLEFKRLVRVLSESGKTLLISSHILSELEDMSDMMILIDKGRIVHCGSAESLKHGSDDHPRFLVKTLAPREELKRWADMNPGVEYADVAQEGGTLVCTDGSPEFVADLLKRLVESGLRVTEFRRIERRLEEVFVDTLERSRAAGGSRSEEET